MRLAAAQFSNKQAEDIDKEKSDRLKRMEMFNKFWLSMLKISLLMLAPVNVL